MKAKKAALKIPWEKIGLLMVMIWLLGIQVNDFFLPKSAFEKAKERVIRNPNDVEARLVLTEELLKNNRLKEAESELKKNSNDQSEISLELERLWQQKQENDPTDLEVLIQKWQKILKEKPDYRDGWLKLALYLIKVGRISEAREALEKAKQLDPNYEIVGELEAILHQEN